MDFKFNIDLTIKADPAVVTLIEKIFGVTGAPAVRVETPAEEIEAETPAVDAPVAAPAPANSYPDDEEMRKHMDMVISKFAGNGWSESKDQRTLTIKKGCTKAFKEIAKWLGAERPTALVGDQRLEFVKRLDEIYIEEDKDNANLPVISFRPF